MRLGEVGGVPASACSDGDSESQGFHHVPHFFDLLLSDNGEPVAFIIRPAQRVSGGGGQSDVGAFVITFGLALAGGHPASNEPPTGAPVGRNLHCGMAAVGGFENQLREAIIPEPGRR